MNNFGPKPRSLTAPALCVFAWRKGKEPSRVPQPADTGLPALGALPTRWETRTATDEAMKLRCRRRTRRLRAVSHLTVPVGTGPSSWHGTPRLRLHRPSGRSSGRRVARVAVHSNVIRCGGQSGTHQGASRSLTSYEFMFWPKSCKSVCESIPAYQCNEFVKAYAEYVRMCMLRVERHGGWRTCFTRSQARAHSPSFSMQIIWE